MSNAGLLTKEQLAESAFDLLTSSGIDRYARMAKRAALRSGLLDRLKGEHRSQQIALLGVRALELASVLAASTERDESEVELAAIVAALSTADLQAIDRLLKMLGNSREIGLVWIAALARRLQSERVVVNSDAPPVQATEGRTIPPGRGCSIPSVASTADSHPIKLAA